MSILTTTMHDVKSISIKDARFNIEKGKGNPFTIRTISIVGTKGKEGEEVEVKIELFTDGDMPAQLII